MPESKAHETARYLGYTLGVVAAGAVALALYVLLAPILELVMLLAIIAGGAFFAILCVAAVFYLFIAKDRK